MTTKQKPFRFNVSAYFFWVLLGLGCLLTTVKLALGTISLSVSPPQKTGFHVKFKKEVSSHHITSAFVLPGEEFEFEILDDTDKAAYMVAVSTGQATLSGRNKWTWTAPQKTGIYPLELTNHETSEKIVLNIFVTVPYNKLKDGYLNSYRIGSYPHLTPQRLFIHNRVSGFIEVTAENENTYVSQHFQLKQFVCKQSGNYPKYVALQERLLLNLEAILQKANEHGYRCNTFHVMSGYRTPYYNRNLGNARLSSHMWGSAADIFIDEHPKDGYMDDLNKDGVLDKRDALVLYRLIDTMYGQLWYKPFEGGLGLYGINSKHGPFVHVDVRGVRSRWERL